MIPFVLLHQIVCWSHQLTTHNLEANKKYLLVCGHFCHEITQLETNVLVHWTLPKMASKRILFEERGNYFLKHNNEFTDCIGNNLNLLILSKKIQLFNKKKFTWIDTFCVSSSSSLLISSADDSQSWS